ncbi:hypothetical protein JCM19992_31520 [Thermostilla marina]
MIREEADNSLPMPGPSGGDAARRARPADRIYDSTFWLAATANTITIVGASLLYRYADLVKALGGTDFDLGWIVGIGVVGSLVSRLFLGNAIDRYGARPFWLAGLLLTAASCAVHPALTTCRSPVIYLARIAFCLGVAAIFSASISFLAARVSRAQAAEMIGMIGSAGFAGMLIGAQVADFLVSLGGSERQAIDRLFYAAAVLTLVALPFAWAATRRERPIGRAVNHSAWRITVQYSTAGGRSWSPRRSSGLPLRFHFRFWHRMPKSCKSPSWRHTIRSIP